MTVDRRPSLASDLTLVWRGLSMLLIAAVIVGFVVLLSGSLLTAENTNILLALALVWPPSSLLRGAVPPGTERE